MSQAPKHQHVAPQPICILPKADRPTRGFPTTSEPVYQHGKGKYVRPQNEKLFIAGMRSVFRGVKRMKKESSDFCGLYGNLHYQDTEDWRRILAPRDRFMDIKMLNALLSRPPRVQCYCACFCP